jgi:hypothetical protein
MKELKTILPEDSVKPEDRLMDFHIPGLFSNLKQELTQEELMTHLETELKLLKSEQVSMWNLVSAQLKKSLLALVKNDKDLAHEV